MHIALLTAHDVTQYRNLMLQAYEDAADAFTSTVDERAAESESWWVQRIGGPQDYNVAFGAFSGDQLVGTVALKFSPKPKTQHRVLLIGMYVLSESRGCGIGKALLEAADHHALSRSGVRTMALTVTEGNSPAIALYESLGFKPIGVEPMAILTPGGYKAKVQMWKELVACSSERNDH